MIDKALSLFERLVIALETLATNQQASSTVVKEVTSKRPTEEDYQEALKEVGEEDLRSGDSKKTSTKAKSTTKTSTRKSKAVEPDDEPEPEEETKKTRTRKSKEKGDDKLDEKRDAIKEIATLISEDDSDDAEDMEDALDELLEKFDVKKVADLEDDQVAEFYSELLEVANEWFELEEIK